MRSQPTRTISGRVNADGTPVAAGEFTSHKTGTGIYALAFPSLARLLAIVSSGAASPILAFPGGISSNGVNIFTLNSTTGAATDSAFYFTATVSA